MDQLPLLSILVGLAVFCAVLLLAVGIYFYTGSPDPAGQKTTAGTRYRASASGEMSTGRRIYYWANLLVNPLLFAFTFLAPSISDWLQTMPESVGLAIAAASMVVRLGWVIVGVALHPLIALVWGTLTTGRRLLLAGASLLFLLAFAEAAVLGLLALLWLDALANLGPWHRKSRRRVLFIEDTRPPTGPDTDIEPEGTEDPDGWP